jgi:hypothetical protein
MNTYDNLKLGQLVKIHKAETINQIMNYGLQYWPEPAIGIILETGYRFYRRAYKVYILKEKDVKICYSSYLEIEPL